MTSRYLDTWELADELKISQGVLMQRLKREPWKLPPLAHLGKVGLLRWRQVDVERWKVETGVV